MDYLNINFKDQFDKYQIQIQQEVMSPFPLSSLSPNKSVHQQQRYYYKCSQILSSTSSLIKTIMIIVVFKLAFMTMITAVNIIPNKLYLTSSDNGIRLDCTGFKYDTRTVVVFYANNQMLYNSSNNSVGTRE